MSKPGPTSLQTKLEPTQIGPTQIGPTQIGPTQIGPTKAGPTKAGPTQIEPYGNGHVPANGRLPENGQTLTIADALHADAGHDGHANGNMATNGNGAGYTAAKLPYEPQPEMELALPGGGGPVALTSVLESLLFVAGEGVDVSHLAKSLDMRPEEVQAGLALLTEQYKTRGGGLRVQVYKGRYQLVTAPVTGPFVEAFLNVDVSTKLSSAALETLAIVAYRQPVTRVQIEAIRGVDCSNVLRSLVVRGLIEEVGRLDAVGRPIVYGVTELFLQHFGLTELAELPPLGSEDADMLAAATALAEEADLILEDEPAAGAPVAHDREPEREVDPA